MNIDSLYPQNNLWDKTCHLHFTGEESEAQENEEICFGEVKLQLIRDNPITIQRGDREEGGEVQTWRTERLLGCLFTAHEARTRTWWGVQCDYNVHACFTIMMPIHRYFGYQVKASYQSGLLHHLLEPWLDFLPHLLLRTSTNCFSLDRTRTPPFSAESWSGQP